MSQFAPFTNPKVIEALNDLPWRRQNKNRVSAIECSICLEDIHPATACKMDCNHMFHKDCISQVRNTHFDLARCPLCRAPLDGEPVEHRAEYRQQWIHSSITDLRKKIRVTENLPWYKRCILTEAQEADIILDVIVSQRWLFRINPKKPNSIESLELSRYELLLIYYYIPDEEEMIIRIGIMRKKLKEWILNYDEGDIPEDPRVRKLLTRLQNEDHKSQTLSETTSEN